MCFSWSGRTRYVTELAVLLGLLDRPECQYAAKTVRSATREPTNLDSMRMMRLVKFLVSHSVLEWIYQGQDVPEKYVVFGDSDWAGLESRRSTTGAFEQYGLHTIARHCSLERGGRAVRFRMCGSGRVAVSPAVG